MKPTLVIRPEAEEDLTFACVWYEEQRKGLGDYFLLCVEAALGQIERFPEGCRIIHKKIRRMLTQRFPYGVFYLVEKNRIVVLAVLHASQDPKHWKRRS